MEPLLKELTKLDKLTDNASGKLKSPSISDSLDSLLQSLRDTKERLEAGTETQDTLIQLVSTVEQRKKEVDDRQKEIYSSLSRFGKALDKVLHYPSMHSFLEIHTSGFVTEIHQLVAFLLTTVHLSIICNRIRENHRDPSSSDGSIRDRGDFHCSPYIILLVDSSNEYYRNPQLTSRST